MAAFGGVPPRKTGRPATTLSRSGHQVTTTPPSYRIAAGSPRSQASPGTYRQPPDHRLEENNLLMPVDLDLDMSLGKTTTTRKGSAATSANRVSTRPSIVSSSQGALAPRPVIPLKRSVGQVSSGPPRVKDRLDAVSQPPPASPRRRPNGTSSFLPKRPPAAGSQTLASRISNPAAPTLSRPAVPLTSTKQVENLSSLTSLGRSRAATIKPPPSSPAPPSSSTLEPGTAIHTQQANNRSRSRTTAGEEEDSDEEILIQKSFLASVQQKKTVSRVVPPAHQAAEIYGLQIGEESGQQQGVGVFASDYFLHGAGDARRKLGLSSPSSVQESLNSPLHGPFAPTLTTEDSKFSRLFWSGAEHATEVRKFSPLCSVCSGVG
jgi:hypothetical protein